MSMLHAYMVKKYQNSRGYNSAMPEGKHIKTVSCTSIFQGLTYAKCQLKPFQPEGEVHNKQELSL